MWVKLKLLGLDIFEAEITTKDDDKSDDDKSDDKSAPDRGEVSGIVRHTGFSMFDRTAEEGGSPVVSERR